MKKKILKNTGLLVVLSILFTFVIMNIIMYERSLSEMKTTIQSECKNLKNILDQAGEEYLTQEISDLTSSRLTLIRRDGTVLYESMEPVDLMNDHDNRPEFREALKEGRGSDLRSSETLNEQGYYYAMMLENGDVIRVSRNIDTVVKSMLSGIVIVLVLLMILGILALILVNRMAARLIEPINQLDLEDPTRNIAYEELSPLLVRIDRQNTKIREQMDQLRQNQEEYLAITEYMKDGLIVTNNKVVLSINRAAQELFDVTQEDCVNHDIITVGRNEAVKRAFLAALSGKSDERTADISGRTYQLLANPVRAEKEDVTGVVLLILDITEKQRAEMMRKEFSANVSHELKSPLMSISGYAELIENGVAKPEDVKKFAGIIHSEAARLTSLVEDIIKLSRLDEKSEQLSMEDVDLFEVACEVKDHLELKAEQQRIDIGLCGNHVIITGVHQVLYEMIYNLCENAIKYNHAGGHVWINVYSEGLKGAVIAVKDDGIGIDKSEQGRIFERFYRVDKSHSRETGGTGLGLSIVKHGALLHNAKIQVESEIGRGAEIRVYFS
ncbi:PAS domain S-box protein [Blautia liquoris]|uniref:histidine kinase n=1 Tax=Blautia liquoris TaxID=2779518 RepID=A0A7M2RJR3_9FIRM|nr:ATP-binding protein [Blautia liquoris]QOV19580.1 PAS domain S-box protein [Blautia liquoris]